MTNARNRRDGSRSELITPGRGPARDARRARRSRRSSAVEPSWILGVRQQQHHAPDRARRCRAANFRRSSDHGNRLAAYAGGDPRRRARLGAAESVGKLGEPELLPTETRTGTTVHNAYIQILAESGAVGFLMFVVVLVAIAVGAVPRPAGLARRSRVVRVRPRGTRAARRDDGLAERQPAVRRPARDRARRHCSSACSRRSPRSCRRRAHVSRPRERVEGEVTALDRADERATAPFLTPITPVMAGRQRFSRSRPRPKLGRSGGRPWKVAALAARSRTTTIGSTHGSAAPSRTGRTRRAASTSPRSRRSIPEPRPFEAAGTPAHVADQLAAFRRWVREARYANYTYNGLHGFDYTPYVPGLQAACRARVERAGRALRPRWLALSTPTSAGVDRNSAAGPQASRSSPNARIVSARPSGQPRWSGPCVSPEGGCYHWLLSAATARVSNPKRVRPTRLIRADDLVCHCVESERESLAGGRHLSLGGRCRRGSVSSRATRRLV